MTVGMGCPAHRPRGGQLRRREPILAFFGVGGFLQPGGFIGAVLGSILFYRVIRKRDYSLHADTIMLGFPFAWTFGRLGCFIAHDHIGKPDFFLAVQFPGGLGTISAYTRRSGPQASPRCSTPAIAR